MKGEIPAWKVILQECGYPTDVLLLDFETYFDDVLSLKEMSTVEYVNHPAFEILGLATLKVTTDFPDYEKDAAFFADREVPRILDHYLEEYGEDLERCTVVGHNLYFDGLILAQKFGIRPRYMIDTLGLARAWNSRTKNDLDALAKREKLPQKGDTSEFKGISFRTRYTRPKRRGKKGPSYPTVIPVCTAEQLNRLSLYAVNDVKREWELFTLYLPRLSSIHTELSLLSHTLRLFHSPVLEIDYTKAEEIKVMMQAEIDAAMFELGVSTNDISGTLTFKSLLRQALEAAGDTLNRYMKPGKLGDNLAIAKTDEQRDVLLNHPDKRVRDLMEAKVAVKSWPAHISRIDSIVAQAKAMAGKFPVALKYHGAHTGRFSGDEGINPQNLGSRGHELVNAIRTIIVAPSNHTLWIVDASQIEARVLAWIAGQWDLVEKFKNGEEIYCGFATKVLGRDIRKPRKTGIPAVERYYGWARNSIGKVGILGCGYGMGAAKAVGYAQGAIDLDTAHKIVSTYRLENPKITQFWKDIERAFIYTYKYEKSCELPRGLRFDRGDDCDIILTLPSGREIHYHRVKIVIGGQYNQEKIEIWNDFQHCWEYTWGGALTENVVQAMSRDILTDAMLRCEDRGHHVALHVHDELVGVTPIMWGDAALQAGIEELSRPPVWGLECPLGAEGHLSPHYGK